MNRYYINVDTVIDRIREIQCKECNSCGGARCRACETADVIDIVETTDVVDAVEIERYGRWEFDKEYGQERCSECGHIPYERLAFCSNCGAKMDLK